MKTLYHATSYSNLSSIYTNGLEPRGVEKIIYFCETPQDCLKFAVLHGVKDILVLKVELKNKDVFETFDHNEGFFKCKCYGCSQFISVNRIKEAVRYRI